ncbi:hypothetical protein BURC_00765 [Burkholderiaceae bacterium]|nr:hypothetical protein BURC_00765 [Burkholderiaceae bacterium]
MNTTRMRLLFGGLPGLALVALGLMASGPAVAAGSGTSSAQAPGSAASATATMTKKKPPARPKRLIDINSASRAQLKNLPGIGDIEADRIIAGRPYKTKADLAETKVIPTGTYLSIRHAIIAKQPKKPSGKAQGQ